MKTYSPFPIDVVNEQGSWLSTYRFEPFLDKWFYVEPNMKGTVRLVESSNVPSKVLGVADQYEYVPFSSYVAPIKMQIQLNTSCNYRCRMCYVSPELRGKSLSLKELDSLFAAAKQSGVVRVNFVGGEIFTRNDIGDVVDLARSHHLLTSCITNGIVPGNRPDKYQHIFDNMYMVQVSCNGIGDSYNYEHCGNYWQRASRCIENSVHMASASILSYVITSENVDDIPRFIEYAAKVNPTIVKFGTVCWSGRSAHRGARQYYSDTLVKAGKLIQKVRTEYPDLQIQSQIDRGTDTPLWEDYSNGYRPYEFYFSPEGRDGLYVSAIGKIYPFPLLSDNPHFCVGTINDNLMEIWRDSQRLKELRSVSFANSACGKLGCTSVCGLWNRSYAISWSGDMYGKVPCELSNWE